MAIDDELKAQILRYYVGFMTMSGKSGQGAILIWDCRPTVERPDPTTRHKRWLSYRLLRKPSRRSPGR